MNITINQGKCLNPNCERKQKSRGLCGSCYDIAARLVREHRVTWEELEQAGKVREAGPVYRKTNTTKWLLTGKEKSNEHSTI